MRLNSIDYFRAVAILFIVAGHSFGSWKVDNFIEKAIFNLLTGGTTLFVFISGFLFHYIYYRNFSYKTFLLKKFRYVYFPYLLLTLSGITYYLISEENLPSQGPLGIDHLETLFDYIHMIALYLWTGKIVVGYWYIQFIAIIFILSPVFIYYMKFPFWARNALFLIFLIQSMLIHRPFGNFSPWHSVLYFLPIYLMGINVSIHRKKVIDFISDKTLIIGMLVLALALLQASIYSKHGNFHKIEIFSYQNMDIIILQKIALCFFLMSLFHRFEERQLNSLKGIASMSFAIYFIHPWILKLLFKSEFLNYFKVVPELGLTVFRASVVFILSMTIAYFTKILLKEKSRFVTGW